MEGTRVRRSRRKRVEFDSRTMSGKDRRWNSRLIGGKRERGREKKERKYRGGVGSRQDHKDDSLLDIVVVFGHCRPLDRAESKWQTVTRFQGRPVHGLRIISLWWLAPLISRPNNRDRFMQIPTIAPSSPSLPLSLGQRRPLSLSPIQPRVPESSLHCPRPEFRSSPPPIPLRQLREPKPPFLKSEMSLHFSLLTIFLETRLFSFEGKILLELTNF